MPFRLLLLLISKNIAFAKMNNPYSFFHVSNSLRHQRKHLKIFLFQAENVVSKCKNVTNRKNITLTAVRMQNVLKPTHRMNVRHS